MSANTRRSERPRAGAVELLRRGDEAAALGAEAADVARALAAARDARRGLPALDEEGARLRGALLLERRRAAALSAALESPENQSRRAPARGNRVRARVVCSKTATGLAACAAGCCTAAAPLPCPACMPHAVSLAGQSVAAARCAAASSNHACPTQPRVSPASANILTISR